MNEQFLERAVFGGGCFWCLEATFARLRGVEMVISGYAGGAVPNPTYEAVSSGATGHAEVTEIRFDPQVIEYRTLLRVFFTLHDPTTLNRQGHDVGTQYRSIILCTDQVQEEVAREVVRTLESEGLFVDPIVTEVRRLEMFFPAEREHQRYYETHREAAYCQLVIAPKVAALRASFQDLLTEVDRVDTRERPETLAKYG